MPGKLQREIKQNRPIDTLEEEAYLNIQLTANVLIQGLADVLKAHDLTPTQYNVLRILRGAGPAGLCRGEVRDRLVAQVPDVTRLLDRLEAAGLVERERGTEDRRFVTTRITAEGLRLLELLDQPVDELHRGLLGHLDGDELKILISLLAKVRSG